MGRRAMTGIAFAAAIALAASVFAAGALAAGPSSPPANEHVCGTPASGSAQCFAIRHNGAAPAGKGGGHKPGPEPEPPPPSSYGASALQGAYGLTGAAATAGAGSTVAIVDAYDDPNAYEDLARYREEQGLPGIGECAPSSIAGSHIPCLSKVNQEGAAGLYPSGNTGWAEEISLDLDMVSAICPNCNILLVEASTNSFENLAAAVDTAATFSPVAIGNSYGGSEFGGEEAYAAAHYSHPGIAITAASGDNGYGAEFPAAGPNVIAVGGTSLREEGGGWSQSVWSGAGSGCSAYVAKPGWQSDTGCANRTVTDTAAVADPNTGVQVYDTYNEPGKMVFGGTSASTQIIAGLYGLLGHGASDASALYGGGSILFGSANGSLADVTSGSNGSCTGHGRRADSSLAYLCTGEVGYDGPTGMGTPAGTGGF